MVWPTPPFSEPSFLLGFVALPLPGLSWPFQFLLIDLLPAPGCCFPWLYLEFLHCLLHLFAWAISTLHNFNLQLYPNLLWMWIWLKVTNDKEYSLSYYSFACDFKVMKNMRSKSSYPLVLKMPSFDCDWQLLTMIDGLWWAVIKMTTLSILNKIHFKGIKLLID